MSLKYLISAPFLFGFLLRLVLFFWGFDVLLSNRKEIVTPITSFHRVTEGLFLYKLGHSPYVGDVFHQPPLILLPFYFLQTQPYDKLFFVFIDMISAFILCCITSMWQKNNNQNKTGSVLSMKNLPELAASIYLFNPLTVMTCVGMSTIVLSNFAVFLAVYFALKGNTIFTAMSLSLASYLSVYPILLLLPLSLLLNKSWISVLIYFFIFFGCLIYSSFFLFNSWDFINDTYGFTIFISDLSPNIGLFWYYFTEVFLHFRKFYIIIFQYHTFIYAFPLYIRLWRHPMLLVWLNLAIIAVFKSYPAIGDITLQLAFLPLIFDEVKGARNGFLAAIVGIFSAVLAPIFWLMWIYQGTGNANFYYAINLVLTVAQILYITDCIGFVLKDDYLKKKEQHKNNLVS